MLFDVGKMYVLVRPPMEHIKTYDVPPPSYQDVDQSIGTSAIERWDIGDVLTYVGHVSVKSTFISAEYVLPYSVFIDNHSRVIYVRTYDTNMLASSIAELSSFLCTRRTQ